MEDTITSSPLPIPKVLKASSKAAVPFIVTTAFLAFTYLAKSSSNLSTKAPAEDTQFVSKHCFIYFHSFPLISGIHNGIILSTPFSIIIYLSSFI